MSKTEESGSTPTLKLTYFAIEGRAEPTRLTLAYGKVAFEDVRIKFPQWKELKPTTPYGKLPLLEVDGVTYSQSGAMLRYAGSLTGTYPTSGAKQLAVEVALGLVDELDNAFTPCFLIANNCTALGYPEGNSKTDAGKAITKAMRAQFATESLPKYFKFFTEMLTKNAPEGGVAFLTGAEPTIADFHAVPNLQKYTRGFIDHVPTTCMDDFPELKAYIARVLALPGIAEYRAALAK